MDLIYTDKHRNDVGILKNFTLDLAFGSDENDFELTIPCDIHCCEDNSLIYIEDTEYGGIVDGIGVTTAENKLRYIGRTWQGILASKVIKPDKGKAYLTVSGDANVILGDLIERLGLSDLFAVSDEASDVFINSYSFERYPDAYSGISKMLSSNSGKLKFRFKDGKVLISALPIVDYSKDEQFDNDSVELDVEKKYNSVNHIICLGKGELENREVIHLYLDANGEVSGEQVFFGLQEMIKVYDFPNAESSDELRESGIEKLKEYAKKDKADLNFTAEEVSYDIGDIIGTKELITNTLVSETITKKIVTINEDLVNVQYKVGE